MNYAIVQVGKDTWDVWSVHESFDAAADKLESLAETIDTSDLAIFAPAV